MTAFPTEEADADTLPDSPAGDRGTESFDAANRFVSGHAGEAQAWPLAFDGEGIGMTDTARLNTNTNLTGAGLGNRPFHQPQSAGGYCFHCIIRCCHVNLLTVSTASESYRRQGIEII